MRDRVHRKQNFTQNFDPNVDILVYFFFETVSRDEVTRRDEIETVSSRLVSRFFETRPSRYRPYSPPNSLSPRIVTYSCGVAVRGGGPCCSALLSPPPSKLGKYWLTPTANTFGIFRNCPRGRSGVGDICGRYRWAGFSHACAHTLATAV